MRPLRILVTGAAGFIGSHTVDRLIASGFRVLGVDDLSTGRLSNLHSALNHHSFSFIQADISESHRFHDICGEHEPDAIIHLAGLVSVTAAQSDPGRNYRLNLHATHLVAEAARHHGIKRIVFASSAAVYGENESLPLTENMAPLPVGMYGTAKLASEQLLLGYGGSYGISAVCLRYFNVFGPRQDPQSPYSGVVSIFAEKFAARQPVTVFGDGEQTRDFINVEDVARANVLAAITPDLGSLACNVCTGQPHSLSNLLEVFQHCYPKAPEPRYEPARKSEIRHSCGAPARAERILKFRSWVPLGDGLRKLADSQRQSKASA